MKVRHAQPQPGHPSSSSSFSSIKSRTDILTPIPAPTTTTTTPPTPSEPSSTRTEPYHVTRTPSHQLPIYLLAKRGGNLHQTRVKKIEGDIAALRRELQLALVIAEEDIKINQLTRHIIIKVRAELTGPCAC